MPRAVKYIVVFGWFGEYFAVFNAVFIILSNGRGGEERWEFIYKKEATK